MGARIAEFLAWIPEDAGADQVINDAKAMTWAFEAEHSIVRLEDGRIALVRGGRDGIEFIVREDGGRPSLRLEVEGREFGIDRILWHTHPRVTGPSDGDLEALRILGQAESRIYELGGDPDGTRIAARTKPGLG